MLLIPLGLTVYGKQTFQNDTDKHVYFLVGIDPSDLYHVTPFGNYYHRLIQYGGQLQDLCECK